MSSFPLKRIIAVVVLGFLLLPVLSVQAQECQETAQNQIEAALDRTTNTILLRDVLDDYGKEGKSILVQIAGDSTQPSKRRGQAIQLLGEHRSDAGERLLMAMLHDPKTICAAISPLQQYRDPQLIPNFVALLDDKRSCGNMVRFSTGGNEREESTEVSLSDEAVGALERLTGKRLEKERDLFLVGHRATRPWKEWWNENRDAFQTAPSSFLAPELS